MTCIDGSGKQPEQSTRMNPVSAPWIEEQHSHPAPRHRPSLIMDTHRRRRRRLRFAPLFLRRRIVAPLLLCRCSLAPLVRLSRRLAPLLLRKRLLAPCRLRRRRLEREGREQPGRTAGRAERISISRLRDLGLEGARLYSYHPCRSFYSYILIVYMNHFCCCCYCCCYHWSRCSCCSFGRGGGPVLGLEEAGEAPAFEGWQRAGRLAPLRVFDIPGDQVDQVLRSRRRNSTTIGNGKLSVWNGGARVCMPWSEWMTSLFYCFRV